MNPAPPLKPQKHSLHGAFLVHKPAGVTSFGVIEEIRRAWKVAFGCPKKDIPALGHGGTLDPFATGLLIVGIGNGVKLLRYFLGSNKTYSGTIYFGRSTQTGDFTGETKQDGGALPESLLSIQNGADDFVGGDYYQIPPMVSAKLQDGVRLYELARKGIEVERAPKRCHLPRFAITSYDSPSATFEVECTSGTYIRTLAEDLAKKLGTFAHLTSLHRIQSGPFELAGALHRAVTLEELFETLEKRAHSGRGEAPGTTGDATRKTREDQSDLESDIPGFIEFDQLLSSLPSIQCDFQSALGLTQGKKSVLPVLAELAPARSGPTLPIFFKQHLVGVLGRASDGTYQIDRTFPAALEILN